MKILAVSDQVIDRLYAGSVSQAYPDIQMIIGCGDLPYPYLEFLLSIYNKPLFYVPGNHDPEYGQHPHSRVAGGDNVDGEVVYYKGLLIAGLYLFFSRTLQGKALRAAAVFSLIRHHFAPRFNRGGRVSKPSGAGGDGPFGLPEPLRHELRRTDGGPQRLRDRAGALRTGPLRRQRRPVPDQAPGRPPRGT